MNKISRLSLFLLTFAISFYLYGVNSFVSNGFAPFNYEGILFYKNFKNSDLVNIFFRDWSTFNNSNGHPLVYFHNIDFIHLLNGLILTEFPFPFNYIIQCLLSSLVITIIIFMLINILQFNKYNFKLNINQKIFFYIVVFSLFIPQRVILASINNIFLSITLFLTIYHFYVLINDEMIFNKKIVNLSVIVFLSSLVETNISVFLLLITSLYFTIEYYNKKNTSRNISSLLKLFTILCILLFVPRLLQIVQVYLNNLFELYLIDIDISSKLKMGNQVISFFPTSKYEELGIVYFGDKSVTSLLGNLKELFIFYYELTFFGCILLFVFLISYLEKKFELKLNTSNYTVYIVSYIISSIILVSISGDALLKISFSKNGFLNYHIPLLLSIFLILLLFINWILLIVNINIKIIICSILLSFHCGYLFYLNLKLPGLTVQTDFLLFKKQLKKNAIVISNFEPSIVNYLFDTPVAISWFVNSDKLENISSDKYLLKFWNVSKVGCLESPTYFFFSKNPPYSNDDYNITLKRFHLYEKNDSFHNIQESNGFILFELKGIYKFGCLDGSMS